MRAERDSTPLSEGSGGSGPPTPHSSQTQQQAEPSPPQRTCDGSRMHSRRAWAGRGPAAQVGPTFTWQLFSEGKEQPGAFPPHPQHTHLVCPPRADASQAVLTPAPMWLPEPPCSPGAVTQHPECPNSTRDTTLSPQTTAPRGFGAAPNTGAPTQVSQATSELSFSQTRLFPPSVRKVQNT